jgi:hypothetical protein
LIKKLIILFALLILPACTVVHYDYRAEPSGAIRLKLGPAKVHISGTNIEPDKFRSATAEVLAKKGINASFVEDKKNSDIQVQITREHFYTLEQEYLTGLSLGIIPSWGTRVNKFIYRIATSSEQVSVHVDETTYNHILLMPICLLQLPFMTDTSIYKYALSQYINIQPDAQTMTGR